MNRYADPLRCPDCGQPIEYGAASCTRCELPLRGPLAQQLFVTLSKADELLMALRAAARAPQPVAPQPVAPHPVAPQPVAPPPVAAPPVAVPPFAQPPGPLPPTSVGGASVPKILLTLGAGCLLVAALVFLAVTWSVMGVGGRTMTLVGFTVLCGLLTGVVARRGLRGATEALGLVTLGLGTLDVVGADNAGWLGDLSASTFAVILGALMATCSTGACLALRRTASGAFTSGEAFAALATATAVGGVVTGSWGSDELRLLVATLVGIGAVAVADRLRLAVVAAGAGVIASTVWLGLLLAGVDNLADDPSVQHVWGELAAWPALAAAAVAAALSFVPRAALVVRVAAATLGVAIAVLVVVSPVLDEQATEISLTAIGVLVAASVVLWVVPKPWSGAALLSLAGGAAVSFGVAATLVLMAGARLGEAGSDPGRYDDALPARDLLELQPWLLLLAVPALCLGLAAVLRFAESRVDLAAAVPMVAVVTTVGTAASYPLPIALFVAFGLLAAAAFLTRDNLVQASFCLGAALLVSFHSDGLTACALAALLAASAWLVLRDGRLVVQQLAGTVAQLALAASVWTWADLLDQPGEWAAAVGIVVVACLAVAVRKEGLELGAALGAAGLLLVGGLAAPEDRLWTWVAVYLTLAGAGAALQALVRDDRRELGWVGGLLLAMATWVRLADVGVEQPEPYTLPSALALVAVGLIHLRRRPEASTVYALGPGLGLALLPSLLWVLDDPGTLRAAILGLACLGLVVAGAATRWTAPLVYGASVGALVVLRHAGPYVEAGVPRWVLIGSAGVLLVVMGITWEQRVREARMLLGYVRGLR